MLSLFGKKKMQLPIEFGEFPAYTGKIKKGPIVTETDTYKRITYYVSGGIEEYEQLLLMNAYTKKTPVRYEREKNSYIIIEKSGFRYKIAFHKKK